MDARGWRSVVVTAVFLAGASLWIVQPGPLGRIFDVFGDWSMLVALAATVLAAGIAYAFFPVPRAKAREAALLKKGPEKSEWTILIGGVVAGLFNVVEFHVFEPWVRGLSVYERRASEAAIYVGLSAFVAFLANRFGYERAVIVPDSIES